MSCDSRCSAASSPRRRPSILAAATAGRPRRRRAMAGGSDWPMWGGTPSRNMVSAAKGLPDKWDVKTKRT